MIVLTLAAMIECVGERSKGRRGVVICLRGPVRMRFAMGHEWRDVHRVFLKAGTSLGIGADRLGWSWFGYRYLNVDLFRGRLKQSSLPDGRVHHSPRRWCCSIARPFVLSCVAGR